MAFDISLASPGSGFDIALSDPAGSVPATGNLLLLLGQNLEEVGSIPASGDATGVAGTGAVGTVTVVADDSEGKPVVIF